jgi:hypothetical protein
MSYYNSGEPSQSQVDSAVSSYLNIERKRALEEYKKEQKAKQRAEAFQRRWARRQKIANARRDEEEHRYATDEVYRHEVDARHRRHAHRKVLGTFILISGAVLYFGLLGLTRLLLIGAGTTETSMVRVSGNNHTWITSVVLTLLAAAIFELRGFFVDRKDSTADRRAWYKVRVLVHLWVAILVVWTGFIIGNRFGVGALSQGFRIQDAYLSPVFGIPVVAAWMLFYGAIWTPIRLHRLPRYDTF